MGLICAIANACSENNSMMTASPTISAPAETTFEKSDSPLQQSIKMFEERVRRDPEDFSANNNLASLYLQHLRETGDIAYLNLAFRAARTSLDSVPEVRNVGGLAALAQAEFASHDFLNSRDHARRLAELDPRKIYPYTILGDSLLELGNYTEATEVFGRIEQIGNGINVESEIRQARLAQLHGDNAGALKHNDTALTLALNFSAAPPRETIAWLRWQKGETAFSVGDYETAEKHYRDALATFPHYFRAEASLGRALAARDDLQSAIAQYEKVVRILPDPTFVAALGDLYKLAGREEDAKRQYELVEQIGHLSQQSGALYNRQLALFYADHDLKAEEAYQLAWKEYEARKDIYGADALAWTALKANKIAEAQTALKDALRLGTKDARLFYHAAIIARAAGDEAAAHDFLQRALKLNPQFDPLQSAVAKALPESR